jgi:hypothetical protein
VLSGRVLSTKVIPDTEEVTGSIHIAHEHEMAPDDQRIRG